jgi:hypothetical protein
MVGTVNRANALVGWLDQAGFTTPVVHHSKGSPRRLLYVVGG